MSVTLQWRHYERDGVSNHRPTIVYSILRSGADQRKHQSSTSLAFVQGIHRWPVNSPHKWLVTRKVFSNWWRLHGKRIAALTSHLDECTPRCFNEQIKWYPEKIIWKYMKTIGLNYYLLFHPLSIKTWIIFKCLFSRNMCELYKRFYQFGCTGHYTEIDSLCRLFGTIVGHYWTKYQLKLCTWFYSVAIRYLRS